MNRTDKTNFVELFTDKIKKAKAVILTDYRGLNVAEFTDLRKQMTTSKGSINVVKNRLAKLIFKSLNVSGLDEHLKGPTAIAYSDIDPVAPVKAMVEFAKKNDKLKLKAGFMDGRVLGLVDIKALASLPSREVLLSRILSSMNAPATNIACVLSAVPRKLLYALNAIKEKKQ